MKNIKGLLVKFFARLKRHPFKVILILILLFAGYKLYTYSQSSSVGSSTTGSSTAVVEQAETTEKDRLLDAENFTFNYPSEYGRVQTAADDTMAIEQFRLNATSQFGFSKQMAIVIKPLPGGGINDDSGYRIRTQQPDVYKSLSQTLENVEAAMYKLDNHEVTLYLISKPHLATVSITSSSALDPETEAKAVADNFNWK